jgi:glycosyltransferase involved in cell wall biosynthesis
VRIAIVAPLVAPLLACQSRGNHALVLDLAAGLAERGHDVTLHAAAGSDVPQRAGNAAGCGSLTLRPVVFRHSMAGRRIVPGADVAPDPQMRSDRDDAFVAAFRSIAADARSDGAAAVSAHAFDIEALEALEDLPVVHTLHLPPIIDAVVDAVRSTTRPVATVSDSMRLAWSARVDRPVALLRNGVPDLLGARHREAFESKPDAVAVIAGRISPEKGTADAIRVARAAGLRPSVVGEVYDEEYFEQQVAPLLTAGRPQPIERRELAWLFARSAVALMPIRWDEPFGLVAAEAQVAGCPVVAYRRGALPEVVLHGSGGFLVEPGDEAGLVAAVGEARALDRQAVRAAAVARLSFDRTLDAYEATLGAVAA